MRDGERYSAAKESKKSLTDGWRKGRCSGVCTKTRTAHLTPHYDHTMSTQNAPLPPARPALLTRFSVPKGNYDTWDADQAFEAEYVCKLFANSYIIDFNRTATALRLGAPHESAPTVGNQIFNHWLTQHYIQELLSRFETANLATRDRVLGLLWRDASDFSETANSMARVAAQKCLTTALGMTEVQAKARADETLKDLARGGVIMVKVFGNPKDWEAQAEVSQKQMLKDLEEDA